MLVIVTAITQCKVRLGLVCVCVWCRNAERALIIASGSEFRKFSFMVVESRWFSVGILLVILVNTVFIGLQTSQYIVAKSGEPMATGQAVCVTLLYRVVPHSG